MKRAAILFAAVALALVGCAKSASGPGDSGIEGKVLVGPQCPVEIQGSPCPDRPLAADIQVLQDGKVVTTVHSSADGTFRADLEPGHYTLHPLSPTPGIPPTGKDVDVDVTAHQFAHVTVEFDSGIR